MATAWCIIRLVFQANLQTSVRRRVPVAAAVILTAAVAACGSGAATPASPTSPVPTNSIEALAKPTATPNISIVPVPTSQMVAPSTPVARLDPQKAAAFQTALDDVRSKGKYPGAAAAVVFPDGSIWTGESGQAILSPPTPLTAETLFSVASISKTFVAALVSRLVQTGTISLDDSLSKYEPDFPNAANITVRELLNHTSGIADLFDVNRTIGSALSAHPAATWTAAQVLAKIGNPYFAPGTGYHYSNTNFILLGLIIEKATGLTVAALVRSTFLEPLGLDHTYLQTEEGRQGSSAHGYIGKSAQPVDRSAGPMLPFTAEATAVGFAGAYVSTASDLARWADALYSGKVLDQAGLASMVDVSPTVPYKPRLLYGYGLGFEESTVAGQLAWGHKGHLDGFWSAMEYFPAYHVTVVVLTNADWADPIAASSNLVKIAIT